MMGALPSLVPKHADLLVSESKLQKGVNENEALRRVPEVMHSAK